MLNDYILVRHTRSVVLKPIDNLPNLRNLHLKISLNIFLFYIILDHIKDPAHTIVNNLELASFDRGKPCATNGRPSILYFNTTFK